MPAENVKQVIVMRTDLNMRKGKMIAQGAHASIAWLTSRLHVELEPDGGWYHSRCGLRVAEREWIKGRFTKICVRVDSEEELLEVHNAATESKLQSHLITDSGLTEFGGVPTNTSCAVGPDFSEAIDKITGHLTLL